MKTMIDLFSLVRFDEPGAPVANDWIQIMKVGKFEYKGKNIDITQDDLNEFAENFRNKVRGVDLAVDVSHRPEDGSVGWFEDVKSEPGKLMAQIKWTDEGGKLVGSGKFRYFSPEWYRQWTDTESGKTFQNVLFGGALTNRPFLKNMEPVGIAMSEDGESTITFWSDGSDTGESGSNVYDPDGDGDDDSTTDPQMNPDWIDDVQRGHTPFDKATGRQQQMLGRRGITKEKADGARHEFLAKNPQHKDQQFHDRTTKSSQKPNESRATMTATPPNSGTKPLNPNDGNQDNRPIDNGDAGKFSEHHNSSNGGGSMPVSDEQYNTLLAEVNLLKADKRRTMMAEKVDTFIRAGKVVPAQRDNMIATMSEMSDEAAVKFCEIFEKNPQVVTFTEQGFSGDPGTPDGDVLLDELTQQYIGEGKAPRVAASMAFSEVEKRGIKLDY